MCFLLVFFSPFPIGLLLVLLLTEGFDQNGACDAVVVLSVCVGELDFDFAHGMRGGGGGLIVGPKNVDAQHVCNLVPCMLVRMGTVVINLKEAHLGVGTF